LVDDELRALKICFFEELFSLRPEVLWNCDTLLTFLRLFEFYLWANPPVLIYFEGVLLLEDFPEPLLMVEPLSMWFLYKAWLFSLVVIGGFLPEES
jgi:hypothetical protein